jgi:hypothetical protein
MSFLDKFFGPPNIAKLREKVKVPDLIKALSYEDKKIQLDAEKALVEIVKTGRTDVIYRLVDFGLKSPASREAAIRIIRASPGPYAADILLSLLDAATRDYDQLSPSALRESLAGLSWVTEILIGIGTKGVKQVITFYAFPRFEGIVEHIVTSIGDPAFEVLSAAALTDENVAVREQAARFIQKLTGPGVKKFVNGKR